MEHGLQPGRQDHRGRIGSGARRRGAVGRGRTQTPGRQPLAVKEGGVPRVAFSPDGKTIAAGYRLAASAAAVWCYGTWPHASAWSSPARREGGPGLERGLQPGRQDHRGWIRQTGVRAAWCCGTWPARKRVSTGGLP